LRASETCALRPKDLDLKGGFIRIVRGKKSEAATHRLSDDEINALGKLLDRYRDQKIALSGVANTLASRRMAHAFSLMQRVRSVIGERALFQNPLVIASSKRRRH
jgi:integrase